VLATIVLVTFAPAWQNSFVNFDDGLYVNENPFVGAGLTGLGFAWAWTTSHAANWHPLTWLSLMLDTQLFGPAPWGYHLTNVLLHLANTLLLFVLWRRLTAAPLRSAAVAALFAVHPLHVESVAWIAERKDVLSTFFGLLALLTYARYTAAPGVGRYLAVVLGMALSLLAKPMLVTLPFLLLLLDYWPLGRWGDTWRPPAGLLLEKLPLLALSAASSVVTVWAQEQGDSFSTLAGVSLPIRLANAAVSYVAYLRQALLPVDLAVFYPYAVRGPGPAPLAGAVALLAAVTALALWQARRRPYLVVGWLWYLGALVPVIGLVQVGGQARADRYTYLPLVGIFVAVVWGVADLARRLGAVRAVAWLGGAVLAYLMLLSWTQTHYWHDSVMLWEHSLQVTQSNVIAHQALGAALLQHGEVDEAVRHYRIATHLNPRYAMAHNDLGNALLRQGNIAEAVAHYRDAARLDPGRAAAHVNLAVVLLRQGDVEGAVRHGREALRLDPGLARTHLNLGLALQAQGHLQEAVGCLRQAVALEPRRAEYHRALAHALTAQGGAAEARAEYQESLRLDPDWPPALTRRALALATDPDPGRRDGRRALREAEQVLQATGDGDPEVLDALAAAQAEVGLFDAAAATARKARQQAEAAGRSPLARQIDSRLRLYERHQPFRAPAP
jgi:tetratricopeptide (TPR) repeat protein